MKGLLWLGVGALGGLGALLRFLVDGMVMARTPGGFPWGTLAVNASGSFLLGLLAGLHVDGTLLLLAGTATLGSYTTFSTWMFETHRLGEDGELSLLAHNLLLSVILGLGLAKLGHSLGGAL